MPPRDWFLLYCSKTASGTHYGRAWNEPTNDAFCLGEILRGCLRTEHISFALACLGRMQMAAHRIKIFTSRKRDTSNTAQPKLPANALCSSARSRHHGLARDPAARGRSVAYAPDSSWSYMGEKVAQLSRSHTRSLICLCQLNAAAADLPLISSLSMWYWKMENALHSGF